MELVWFLLIGIVAGWLAGVLFKGSGFGLVGDMIVGVIGALLGGWFISPLVGAGTINQGDFSLAGMGVSLIGAIILLAIVNLVRRGSAR